jgi:hypothetical protein
MSKLGVKLPDSLSAAYSSLGGASDAATPIVGEVPGTPLGGRRAMTSNSKERARQRKAAARLMQGALGCALCLRVPAGWRACFAAVDGLARCIGNKPDAGAPAGLSMPLRVLVGHAAVGFGRGASLLPSGCARLQSLRGPPPPSLPSQASLPTPSSRLQLAQPPGAPLSQRRPHQVTARRQLGLTQRAPAQPLQAGRQAQLVRGRTKARPLQLAGRPLTARRVRAGRWG